MAKQNKASHSHAHHDHAQLEFNRAFFIAVVANGLYALFQFVFALMAHSTSLLADSVHNLGDVLSLGLSWIASHLLKSMPTQKTTYGMKKTTILAAMANGMLLVFSCGVIVTEAINKLFSPVEIHALSVIIVASMGILVNGVTARLFLRGSDDLNIRSAFLHLIYDAFISFGVVISALVLYFTDWRWIDPLVGIAIAVIIVKGTWTLFRESFKLIIDGVPREISWAGVYDSLKSMEGVQDIHDLHIWALSTRENALSVHLFMPDADLTDEARQAMVHMLRDKHRIHHATIQVERDRSYCHDACKPALTRSA